MKLLTLILALSLVQPCFAHEGHNHTPGVITAPHGGVITGTNELYFELVSDSAGLKLYPLTHDLAPVALSEVTLTATARLPKKARKEVVKFSANQDHFTAKFDAKGAHRYTLELTSKYKGKKESVKFQVEPQ